MEQLLVELPIWNSSDFNYNGATGNVGPMFWSHYSYLGLDPSNLKINMLITGP
jgi:hypothetical protein